MGNWLHGAAWLSSALMGVPTINVSNWVCEQLVALAPWLCGELFLLKHWWLGSPPPTNISLMWSKNNYTTRNIKNYTLMSSRNFREPDWNSLPFNAKMLHFTIYAIKEKTKSNYETGGDNLSEIHVLIINVMVFYGDILRTLTSFIMILKHKYFLTLNLLQPLTIFIQCPLQIYVTSIMSGQSLLLLLLLCWLLRGDKQSYSCVLDP